MILKNVKNQFYQESKNYNENRLLVVTVVDCQFLVWNRLVTALFFSRIFIGALNARIESRENGTPVQNGRLHGLQLIRFHAVAPIPSCFAFALAFFFASVEKQRGREQSRLGIRTLPQEKALWQNPMYFAIIPRRDKPGRNVADFLFIPELQSKETWPYSVSRHSCSLWQFFFYQ